MTDQDLAREPSGPAVPPASRRPERTLPRRGRLAAVLAPLLAWVACAPPLPAEPEEESSGCSTDADCPPGRLCAAGSCLTPPGPAPSECVISDDCLAEPLSMIPDVYWDGDGQLCTLDPEGCATATCPGRRVCLPPGEGATRPGAIACSSDAQCHSGHCVEHAGDHVCLKTCGGDQDCASERDEAGEPVGDRCALVEIAGASLLACVPAVPGETLCRNDCDCAADDACSPGPTDPRCRFSAARQPLLPHCEPLPGGAVRPVLSRCDGAAVCAGGACLDPCDSAPGAGAKHFCAETQNRCAQPCDADSDCPQRTQCLDAAVSLRAGSWLLPLQKPEELGRNLRYCQLPIFGCFEEQDCFPYVDSNGDPIVSWGLDTPGCQVQILRPSTAPRLVTRCQERDPALAAPGACCESHEGCDSGICAPASPGDPCPVGSCTVPCDPDSDPDGIPGSGDERDRCAELSGEPTNLSGSFSQTRCEELAYERELLGDDGTSRRFATTLRVCR